MVARVHTSGAGIPYHPDSERPTIGQERTVNTSPNSDQIRYWNDVAGTVWARNQQLMDTQLEPLTRPALAAAAATRGEQVVDLGCGCGGSSLMLAQSGARVLGVDISEPMLTVARARAGDHPDVEFIRADAATHDFTAAAADLLFSRFGVMFFDDPTAAFRNIRTALVPGGRLCLLVWRSGQENPWMTLPMAAALQHLPAPPPADPRAPGPFAFAEANYVEQILTGAGFRDVRLDPLDLPMDVGGEGGPEAAARFYLEIGPLQRLLADQDDDVRARVEHDLAAVLQQHTVDGRVRLEAACWIVHAHA